MYKPSRSFLALMGIALGLSGSGAATGSDTAIAGGDIVLYVAMDVIPPWGYGDDCGTLDASSVSANVGDHFHLCYLGLNNTSQTLNVHSISDNVDGDLFTDFDVSIPPGGLQNLAELRFTVESSLDVTHTWVAMETAGGATWTTTTQTHIEAFAPGITLSRNSIDATATAGSVVYETLTIASTGTSDLSWYFGESTFAAATNPEVAGFGLPSTMRAATSFGASAVPAYAVEIAATGSRYVALDAAAPTAPQIIPAAALPEISGGTFVDNDFSHEYLLSDTDGLIEIDTQTGAIDTINALTAPNAGELGWRGLAWDPHRRVLYGLSTDGTLPTLYEIDAHTGTTNRLGAINDRTLTVNGIYSAIAVDSDGRIFAIDETNDLLVTIALDQYRLPDRVSGYTVGRLGFDTNGLVGLAFDYATDTLYLAAIDASSGANGMYAVDTITGAATPVAPIGDSNSRYVALATVAGARPCGIPGDVAWLSMSSYIEAPQPPGQSADVDAILDATHLAPGSYDATICLHSNDATRRKLPIPVHLTVGAAGDGDIFAEGFDGDMP